ncbi:MAG: glycosyltransferase, partial [Actinomycetota bacterium]
QVVDPGVTGLLVPPRDPAALATAVLELVNDPDRRTEMATAAAARAGEAFDQRRCIDITLAVYRRLLAGAP